MAKIVSAILSDAELVELTKRKRKRAQCKTLDALGVPYRRRPDGSPVVFRSSMVQDQGGKRAPAMRLDDVKRGGYCATEKERPRAASLRLLSA